VICLQDDHSEIAIESVSWNDANLVLHLRLRSDESFWIATCVGALAWRLADRFTEGLQILEDDPVLWKNQFALYTTYFRGNPLDPYRAACDLLGAIPRNSGVLEMKPNELAHLLGTGNGSFGPLPVPAIRNCQAALKQHGIEVYQIGGDLSEVATECSALLMGSGSYVVAESFLFERRT
jgi:hypothetical protein